MEYEKCLVELDEVLNHLSEDDLKKIPEDIKENIKIKKDKQYIWKYDETKELKDQLLNRNTVILLSCINMEYLLNQEQKELMEKIHQINEQNLEKEKLRKYNPNELFKNTKRNMLNEKISLTIIRKEKWYSRIFKILTNIFKAS